MRERAFTLREEVWYHEVRVQRLLAEVERQLEELSRSGPIEQIAAVEKQQPR